MQGIQPFKTNGDYRATLQNYNVLKKQNSLDSQQHKIYTNMNKDWKEQMNI